MKKILKYLIILGLLQANANASSEPPTRHRVESVNNMEMIRVEPGSYKYHNKNDVTITKPFYLGKFEVTQSEWKKINGSIPRQRVAGDNHPVERLRWIMVRDWIAKLNEVEKKAGKLSPNWEYDMPTQGEWEYACRAGTTTKYYWGNKPDTTKSNNDKRIGHAIAVGSYAPNPWGFYDMYGNVWEYTKDSSGAWAGEVSGVDPLTTKGHRCIIRGGAHDYEGHSSTKFAPTKLNDGDIQGTRGFRLALKKIAEGTDNPYAGTKAAPDATPPKTGPGNAPDLKCKETVAKLEKEIKDQKVEITDLNILIIELRKQVADLNSSNLALTTEVSGLKNQVNKLNGQVASLTTENGELKGQVTNLKEDNGNLQVTVTSLNEQLVEADRIAKTPFVHDWVYTPDHGWLYIDPKNFPIIYKNDTQTWHFYEQGSINPRYFYNFKEQKWEAWDPTE
jgi:formylglycine-generating enzyme required for sulfatase activity/regulator of replication initiation timing